jgi:lysozyme
VSSRIVGGTAAIAFALGAPLAAYFEGVIPHSYVDPIGIPSACIGETGPDIKPGMVFTIEQCIARYQVRFQKTWRDVEPCITVNVTPWQAAAVISWTYNVGAYAACHSTLMRMLNSGATPEQWCAQLLRWDKATLAGVKVELAGLKKRRVAEQRMCLGDPLILFPAVQP